MGALFTCSIDDGHPSDLRMAELLARHGLQGTFYIPLKNRERLPVMSPMQMRELAGSFEVGSHTYDHCYLKNVGQAEAAYQVNEGKRRLEDALGLPVDGFCYPGGEYTRRDVGLVQMAGFRYARTIRNFCFDAGSDPFQIPTTIQFYPHPKDVYLRNYVKGRDWMQRVIGLRAVLKANSWMGQLQALFDLAHENNAVFHLWCHSHDIDRLDAWQEMDGLLGYVSARTDTSSRLTNRQLAEHFFGI